MAAALAVAGAVTSVGVGLLKAVESLATQISLYQRLPGDAAKAADLIGLVHTAVLQSVREDSDDPYLRACYGHVCAAYEEGKKIDRATHGTNCIWLCFNLQSLDRRHSKVMQHVQVALQCVQFYQIASFTRQQAPRIRASLASVPRQPQNLRPGLLDKLHSLTQQLQEGSGTDREAAASALAGLTRETPGASLLLCNIGGITTLVNNVLCSTCSKHDNSIWTCDCGTCASNARARRWAAAALANILRDVPTCGAQVLCDGGVPPLVRMLYTTDDQSVRFAVWALKRLAAADDLCRDACINLNVARPAAFLLLHSHDAEAQAHAAELLLRLSSAGAGDYPIGGVDGAELRSMGITREALVRISTAGNGALSAAVQALLRVVSR